MRYLRLMVLAILLAPLAACASGTPSDNLDSGVDNADTGVDVDTPDDAGDDASDAAADATDVADDPCGVCCPGERSCVDETTAGVCADDGSEVVEQDCGTGKICEQGSCVDEPVCQEGETKCLDGSTKLICRPGGTGWRTQSCATGESCLNGQCVSGEANGADCTADADCAGGKCRCGSDDQACSNPPSRTYCTATCTPGSCGPDQICVSSQDFNAASYDHCVPTCNETCPLDSMACVSLPTRDSGDLQFVQGCYPDNAVDIGQECDAAANCSGGTCLQGYFDTGLCTTECTGNCPEGTACVELQGGTYQCTPYCGDGSLSGTGPCPLDPDGSRFDVTCKQRVTFGGGAKRVCVKP